MSLNIPLFDGWGIRSDRYNIILFQNDGNRDTDLYFYSSVEGAIEGFVEKKIKGFNSNSVFGLVQALKSLQTRLNKSLHPLKLKVVSAEEVGKCKK